MAPLVRILLTVSALAVFLAISSADDPASTMAPFSSPSDPGQEPLAETPAAETGATGRALPGEEDLVPEQESDGPRPNSDAIPPLAPDGSEAPSEHTGDSPAQSQESEEKHTGDSPTQESEESVDPDRDSEEESAPAQGL
ncbi:classical arabinogalactan protein 6-like [Ornithorhynchus anatinus]|uniref:classical arabinogalactan protein 6-like n=1 Tax=Ornithorhynchus anatinus TaxID=9258 RepID=UPI0010A89A79|nr:classical arabinogalactan protein 6-like [Ornithorhynchus anatinus]